MSETKHVSPLLDGFAVGSTISEHDGVRCCPAIKENTDEKYILKIISIPASQTQMDALLMAGAYKDAEQAMVYFRELAEDVMQESLFLKGVSRIEGFLPYENWQLEPITRHRLGYEVYLLGTYKRSLEKHVRRHPVTHLEAINLGLDLCSALRVCREAGALYVDLKPSNIFVTEKKEYCIGDLGFIPLDALSYTAMPAKYHSRYTAPELLDPMATVNLTADTYSLGMILYQLYNEGALPSPDLPEGEITPSPVNADYELAEIIMKAIDPDPEKRWQDPKSMGQALASYMQRNVVNDVPITPYDPIDTEAQNVRIVDAAVSETGSDITDTAVFAPITQAMIDAARQEVEPSAPVLEDVPAEEPETPVTEEAGSEDEAVDAAPEAASEPSDDEHPADAEPAVSEESAEEPAEAPVMDEMQKIMAKADELAAHETPGGVVIPEVPDAPDPFAFATEDSDEAMDLTVPMDPIMETPAEKPQKSKKTKKKFLSYQAKRRIQKLIFSLIGLVVLGILTCVGYWYYQNQYLITIDDIRVEGKTNSLTVYVDAKTDRSMISVTCSDSYGNSSTNTLSEGKTIFTGLIPNTMYRIELEIDGFHDLIGKTSDVFTTKATTEIVSFKAVTGNSDGSAVLNLTVNGEEPREWAVIYSTEGEEPLRRTFLGHTVSIDGLSIGKVYTFTLDTGDNLSVSGETTTEYLATRLVLAENLTASTTNGTDITIRWTTPGDIIVDSWDVRCYSPNGYEKKLTVSETEAYLTAIDPAYSYTIEVTAAGMTQPARTSITSHPLNVTALNVDDSSNEKLVVSWEYAGKDPEGGWLVLYTIDGSSDLHVLKCSKPTAEISPRIPDADYQFTIQAADGTSIFSNVHTYSCPEAPAFDHHSLKAENITAYLLKTPERADWRYETISNDEFTEQFKLGDKISVVLRGNVDFYLPGTSTDILYVFRDTHGNALPEYVQTGHIYWKQIWNGGSPHFGELDLPGVPTEPGSYLLRIYFNGEFAVEAPFTITE